MHSGRASAGRRSLVAEILCAAALLAPFGAFSFEVARSVVELQPARITTSIPIQSASGARGSATLVNLSPGINAWYLLTLAWEGPAAATTYHLENAERRDTRLRLDPAFPHGIVLSRPAGELYCELWPEIERGPLASARASGRPHSPLCGERIYLRNPSVGRKTTLEWATDLLRDSVPGGEALTVLVRGTFYEDAFLESSELVRADEREDAGPAGGPEPLEIDPRFETTSMLPSELGIEVERDGRGMLVGRWYAAKDLPGIFVSVIQPKLVAPELLEKDRDRVNSLDEVEASANTYLVAFDLGRFDLGFAMGTEHPRFGWSERAPASARDPKLPGPDGFDSAAPLVFTGKISPVFKERVVATFVGGFKRAHAAFKYGELSQRNHASHYGVVEQGVVLSRPWPGLATLVVWEDGSVDLKTWTPEDTAQLERVRFARQNGVPIIERDPQGGAPRPGALVRTWGAGNWSGSQDQKLRTLRSGACLQRSGERRFLIYGYFSSATPSAMARVFQALGCEYAMLLDINALEHTYLAVYRRRNGDFEVSHLVRGMEVLDVVGKQGVPRFVGFSDNRDFFYVLRKRAPR